MRLHERLYHLRERAKAAVRPARLLRRLRDLEEWNANAIMTLRRISSFISTIGDELAKIWNVLNSYRTCVRCGALCHDSKMTLFVIEQPDGTRTDAGACIWCKDIVRQKAEGAKAEELPS
jgi:hypothetical protein